VLVEKEVREGSENGRQHKRKAHDQPAICRLLAAAPEVGAGCSHASAGKAM
jgi:hypothetical protein